MASLVCQSGLYSLEFSDSTATPKRKRVPLRVRVKRDAEAVRRKLERDYSLGVFNPWTMDARTYDLPDEVVPDEVVPARYEALGAVVTAFVDAKRHKAPRTVDGYERMLRRLAEFVGADTRVRDLTTLAVERWLDSTGAGDVSRQTYVRTLKVFLRWAKREGLTDAVVTDGVRLRKVPRKFGRYLTEDEVARIVQTVRASTPRMQWLGDLVLVAVHTGLRRSELANLRWDAVDLAGRLLTVQNTDTFTTKSGAERKVPLSATALAVLEERRGAAGASAYVFSRLDGEPFAPGYFTAAFAKYAKRAGVADVRLHHLRHTACSWLAMRGVPVEAIRRFAGHSSITVTERYMHLREDVYADAITKAFA